MKLGDKKLQERYKFHHQNDDCEGTWHRVRKDTPLRLEYGMMIVLINAPMIQCDSCGATFLEDGYEDKILELHAQHLITGRRSLSKAAIRWLRTYVGLTQKEVAQELEITSNELCRYESTTAGDSREMNHQVMVRYKLFLAGKLGIEIKPEYALWKVDKLVSASNAVPNMDLTDWKTETTA